MKPWSYQGIKIFKQCPKQFVHRAPTSQPMLYARFIILLALGLCIIWLIGGCATRGPSVLRAEALGGQCKYGPVGNYVWYNDHYDHQLDMTAGCGLIAISKVAETSTGSRVGWRIAYVDLGTAHTNAVFPMLDPEQPFHPNGASCDPATWSGCIGRGIGQQTARGLSAGYIGERDLWGARFGAELGLFAYEGSWTVTVRPEPPSSFAPYSVEWRGPQATPFVGATAQYGYGIAMVRAYARIRAAEHDCVGCSGVAGKLATQVLIGVSIPF